MLTPWALAAGPRQAPGSVGSQQARPLSSRHRANQPASTASLSMTFLYSSRRGKHFGRRCTRGALSAGGCGWRRDPASLSSRPRPGWPARSLERDPGPSAAWTSSLHPLGTPGSLGAQEQGVGGRSSEALHKAAWEETGAAVPLQGSLVPAVLSLLVHKDDVTFLQLNLRLTLGRV
ncbi:hypothetical protein VULLAG_LOCUS5962 [Vulpes lagopus]